MNIEIKGSMTVSETLLEKICKENNSASGACCDEIMYAIENALEHFGYENVDIEVDEADEDSVEVKKACAFPAEEDPITMRTRDLLEIIEKALKKDGVYTATTCATGLYHGWDMVAHYALNRLLHNHPNHWRMTYSTNHECQDWLVERAY